MSEAGDPLDPLPAAILADVLGRVADTGDLAACRLASRALLAASYHCPRVSLSAAARARRLRREGRGGDAFRSAASNVASLIGPYLRSLALDASEGHGFPDDAMWVEEGEFDEGDDLHLTCGESVASWAATAAGPALREVDIADFWPQSCWRKAEALPVISHLYDEDLSALNRCFPCLETLNLIGVGGLKDPKIDLPQLKTCCWEISNIPRSLAIHAPKLVHLELKCVHPEILILDIPSVSTLKLTIDKLGPTVQVDGLVSLTNLRVESRDLDSLLQLFTSGRNIRTLDLELPVSAGPTLQEVDIADFSPPPRWLKAEALPVISHFCHNLLKLRLKNAWLSVDGLKIMPNMTHLALEFVLLDDENLSTLNKCFPCLLTLNLVGVGGLKNPKIHLSQLKTCHWEVSNVPESLAIHAPNLVYLELKCVRPEILILDTPSVSTLKLTIDKLGPIVQVDGFASLTNLRIESPNLNSLLKVFVNNREITTLDLELPSSKNGFALYEAVNPELFSRTTEVKLSPRFSYELMRHIVFSMTAYDCRSCLKKLLVHMPPSILTACPFVPLLNNCAPSCEVTVLFHADSSCNARQAAASVWPLGFPDITWQWGTWQ